MRLSARLRSNSSANRNSNSRRKKLSEPGALLSSRGQRALQPIVSYLPEVQKALKDEFEEKGNPNGYINLAAAENKLLYEAMLGPRLREAHKKLANDTEYHKTFSPFYNDMRGSEAFRKAIAHLMQRQLLGQHSKHKIDKEKICATSGVGGCVDLVAFTVCEEGDACILPAPYYPAFLNDLEVRAGVKPFPAYMTPPNGEESEWEISEEALDDAHKRALIAGAFPRMVLLTNPQNPLGFCYREDQLRLILEWTLKKGLHLVSDEIYASTVHSLEYADAPFISIIDVAGPKPGPFVHILYGLSKDFGLSGHRIGFIYSENEHVVSAVGSLNSFSCVSSETQALLTDVLMDDVFLDQFFKKSKEALRVANRKVMKALDKLGISYFRPSSALFLVIDLRKYLRESKQQHEKAVFNAFFKNKVIITPGLDCLFQEAGFFRLSFSAVSPEALKVFLSDRLPSVIQELET